MPRVQWLRKVRVLAARVLLPLEALPRPEVPPQEVLLLALVQRGVLALPGKLQLLAAQVRLLRRAPTHVVQARWKSHQEWCAPPATARC